MPVQLEYIEFQCYLFGAKVYDESFPDTEFVTPGSWTYSLPFDVPAVAPSTAYNITIKGFGNGMNVFSIDTCFHFA